MPALGIIVYSGLRERSADYLNAVIESQRLADSLSSQQEALTDEAKLLCSLLAGLSEIKHRDVAKTQAILADIHKQSPQYVNILVVDAEGYIWASATHTSSTDALTDRRYFQNARKSKQFSSGEYVVSRTTGKSTIHMAYPLLDGEMFNGVIAVGFDLDVMPTILARAQLAYDANYVLVDHNGTIVNRGKDPVALTGKPIPPEALAKMEAGSDQETFEFIRRDGDNRITTYRKLWLPGEQTPYMYVRAGISKKEVLAKSNRTLTANISTLLFCVLVVLLTVFIIGQRSIVNRIELLQRASQRLAGGDHDFKVASQISGGELGRFAETFDSMATQLSEREKSLQEANRELETFSYTLSHDLKSYLARISLACETLGELEQDRLGGDSQYLLQSILDTCQGMDDLIVTMLTLARVSKQELQHEDIDLSAMAEQVCGELVQTEPERTLRFDIASGLRVYGDAKLLHVALENLFSNACKYTRGKAEGYISLKADRQLNGQQVFALADNGIGFDMSEIDKLFCSFQRLSNSREFPGFGIGLTTVQRIVHRHGGQVWAEATPGEGATFYFTV